MAVWLCTVWQGLAMHLESFLSILLLLLRGRGEVDPEGSPLSVFWPWADETLVHQCRCDLTTVLSLPVDAHLVDTPPSWWQWAPCTGALDPNSDPAAHWACDIEHVPHPPWPVVSQRKKQGLWVRWSQSFLYYSFQDLFIPNGNPSFPCSVGLWTKNC